jgi:hypothetical protein
VRQLCFVHPHAIPHCVHANHPPPGITSGYSKTSANQLRSDRSFVSAVGWRLRRLCCDEWSPLRSSWPRAVATTTAVVQDVASGLVLAWRRFTSVSRQRFASVARVPMPYRSWKAALLAPVQRLRPTVSMAGSRVAQHVHSVTADSCTKCVAGAQQLCSCRWVVFRYTV